MGSNMRLKHLALVTGALLLSASTAGAAVITNDLHLRSGPGTQYRVIGTMPAGAYVDVLGCAGSWCRVGWRGRVGFVSSNYLGRGDGAYAYAPRVYAAPPPAVSFSFGFGNRPRWHHRRNWHRRHGWRRW
jgi:uncharacterized protein YraI